MLEHCHVVELTRKLSLNIVFHLPIHCSKWQTVVTHKITSRSVPFCSNLLTHNKSSLSDQTWNRTFFNFLLFPDYPSSFGLSHKNLYSRIDFCSKDPFLENLDNKIFLVNTAVSLFFFLSSLNTNDEAMQHIFFPYKHSSIIVNGKLLVLRFTSNCVTNPSLYLYGVQFKWQVQNILHFLVNWLSLSWE